MNNARQAQDCLDDAADQSWTEDGIERARLRVAQAQVYALLAIADQLFRMNESGLDVGLIGDRHLRR